MNILVIRNDHIGDLFFSSCVFRELKKAYPDSKITLIASKETKELVKYDKNIDEILELPIAQYSMTCIKSYFKMAMLLRKKKFDVGIDLRGSLMNSAFLLWLARIPKRIGKSDAYENKIKQMIIKLFLNKPIFLDHHKSEVHLKDENLEIIKQGMDIKTSNSNPWIFTSKEDQDIVANNLKSIKKPFICVMPLASVPEKQWSLEKWKQLIMDLDGLESYKVIVMGSNKEKQQLEKLTEGTKDCMTLTGFNIRHLILLFAKNSLVIGQDSGPLHIAGASRCPVIFMSLSDPPIHAHGKFLPMGNSYVLWCDGSNMDSISVSDVHLAIEEML
jgi:lipopolysaccharide heptosyltransferase II